MSTSGTTSGSRSSSGSFSLLPVPHLLWCFLITLSTSSGPSSLPISQVLRKCSPCTNSSNASEEDLVWSTNSCRIPSVLSEDSQILAISSQKPVCSPTNCSNAQAILHSDCSMVDPLGVLWTTTTSPSDSSISGVFTQCLLLGEVPFHHSVCQVMDSPCMHLMHFPVHCKQAFCLFLLGHIQTWPCLWHSLYFHSGSSTTSSSGSWAIISFQNSQFSECTPSLLKTPPQHQYRAPHPATSQILVKLWNPGTSKTPYPTIPHPLQFTLQPQFLQILETLNNCQEYRTPDSILIESHRPPQVLVHRHP